MAIGGIESVTAHDGELLQVRPKAAHGRVRTLAPAYQGEPIATVPRGFYLRPRFTEAMLSARACAPGSGPG
jgi:DNA mismatch repair protein MutH